MLHSRTANNKINRLQERCLRIVYNDKSSSFEDLLEKDGSVSIHHRNLRVLAIEMFKVKNGLSPEIMREVFPMNRDFPYNLRQVNDFSIRSVNSVHYGTESLQFLGPKIWNLVPPEFRNLESLPEFKRKIKLWKPDCCPCRLCKPYLHHVGFI